MSRYLSVTVAPWTRERMIREHGKPNARTGALPSRLTKACLHFALDESAEFLSDRGYLTMREARAEGITHLEVRQGPNLLAVINVETERVS